MQSNDPRRTLVDTRNHRGSYSEPVPVPVAAPHTVSRFTTQPGTLTVSTFRSSNIPSTIETISDFEVLELCGQFDGGGFIATGAKRHLVLSAARPGN